MDSYCNIDVNGYGNEVCIEFGYITSKKIKKNPQFSLWVRVAEAERFELSGPLLRGLPDFEFLSVSYLFSEIVLLGLYWMMQDYVRVDMVPQPAQETLRTAPVDIATMPMEEKILKILSFLKPGEILATREREILEMILMNKRIKEIADELCLSENTIKTYTRTLYGKLGVSSREELHSLLVK